MSYAAAGFAMNVAGSLMSAEADKQASRHNEFIAQQNAFIAAKQGIELERKQRIMGRQALGDIKSGYAASGVTMEGSALDVLENSAANAELDALTIKWETGVKARGYQMEARMESKRRESIDQTTAVTMIGAGFGMAGG